MNYPEFLEKLKQTPRDWFLMCSAIRRQHYDGDCAIRQCPISSLSVTWPKAFNFFSAATELGIERELANDIVYAADHVHIDLSEKSSEIRADLLKACGLA